MKSIKIIILLCISVIFFVACGAQVDSELQTLCQESLSQSPKTELTVQPPILVLINQQEDEKWDIYEHPFLPDIEPGSEKTIVCIKESTEQLGDYVAGNGDFKRDTGNAYQLVWDVRVIDADSGSVVGKGLLAGGTPPVNVVQSGDYYGNPPVNDLLELISWVDQTLFVTQGSINQLAFSPNNKTLMAIVDTSGNLQANELVVWSLENNEELLAPVGREIGRVIAIAPHENRIASAQGDEFLKLWDAATAQEQVAYRNFDFRIYGLAFSPDAQTLALGGSDKTIRLWDVATGQETGLLTGHKNWVNALAFSPDGRILASSGEDRTVILWDLETGSEIITINKPASTFAFSPDNKLLVFGSNAHLVIWDLTQMKEIKTPIRHGGVIHAVAFSPDGRLVASGSDDNTVILWRAADGGEVATFSGHGTAISGIANSGAVLSVAFSPDGQFLASGGRDGVVKIWELDSFLDTTD